MPSRRSRQLREPGATASASAVDVDSRDLGGFGPAPRTATTVPAHREAPLTPHTPPGTVPPPPSGLAPPDGRPGHAAGSGGPGPEAGRTDDEHGGPASAGGASTVAEPGDGRSSRWWPGPIGVLAAVVTVSVSVTLVIHEYGSSAGPGSSSAGSPSPSTTGRGTPDGDAAFGGVRTTSRGCAAADVEGVGGRSTAECWSGITDISGSITVSRADCHIDHVWETFAIAPLPKDGMTYNARDLARHPAVRTLCSQQVMRNSLTSTGRADRARWNVDVLPPTTTQWAEGPRVFRCVAAAVTDDGQTTNSHFVVAG